MVRPSACGENEKRTRACKHTGEADGVRTRGDKGKATRNCKRNFKAAIARKDDTEVVHTRENNSKVVVMSTRVVKRLAKS